MWGDLKLATPLIKLIVRHQQWLHAWYGSKDRLFSHNMDRLGKTISKARNRLFVRPSEK